MVSIGDVSASNLQRMSDAGSPLQSRSPVYVKLFVDATHLYPAVWPEDAASASQVPRQRVTGKLRINRSSSLSWLIAFFIVMAGAAGLSYLFMTFVGSGVDALVDNMDDYKKGVEEFAEKVQHFLPDTLQEQFNKKIRSAIASEIPNLFSEVAAQAQTTAFELVMFLIYLMFWIFEPLPIGSPVTKLFKAYLLLKTGVCFLFAAMMSLLLYYLKCKIWGIFFIVTFLLNYLPELGAILSAILMLPAILFDGSQTISQRQSNVFILITVGILAKVFTGNVIEVQLYAKSGGQFMRMHPVVLMAVMMLCEVVMGLTGMFMAVPVVAVIKWALISTDMPPKFLHPILVFIEGDEHSPHKNYVDRRRTKIEVLANEMKFVERRRAATRVAIPALRAPEQDASERTDTPEV